MASRILPPRLQQGLRRLFTSPASKRVHFPHITTALPNQCPPIRTTTGMNFSTPNKPLVLKPTRVQTKPLSTQSTLPSVATPNQRILAQTLKELNAQIEINPNKETALEMSPEEAKKMITELAIWMTDACSIDPAHAKLPLSLMSNAPAAALLKGLKDTDVIMYYRMMSIQLLRNLGFSDQEIQEKLANSQYEGAQNAFTQTDRKLNPQNPIKDKNGNTNLPNSHSIGEDIQLLVSRLLAQHDKGTSPKNAMAIVGESQIGTTAFSAGIDSALRHVAEGKEMPLTTVILSNGWSILNDHQDKDHVKTQLQTRYPGLEYLRLEITPETSIQDIINSRDQALAQSKEDAQPVFFEVIMPERATPHAKEPTTHLATATQTGDERRRDQIENLSKVLAAQIAELAKTANMTADEVLETFKKTEKAAKAAHKEAFETRTPLKRAQVYNLSSPGSTERGNAVSPSTPESEFIIPLDLDIFNTLKIPTKSRISARELFTDGFIAARKMAPGPTYAQEPLPNVHFELIIDRLKAHFETDDINVVQEKLGFKLVAPDEAETIWRMIGASVFSDNPEDIPIFLGCHRHFVVSVAMQAIRAAAAAIGFSSDYQLKPGMLIITQASGNNNAPGATTGGIYHNNDEYHQTMVPGAANIFSPHPSLDEAYMKMGMTLAKEGHVVFFHKALETYAENHHIPSPEFKKAAEEITENHIHSIDIGSPGKEDPVIVTFSDHGVKTALEALKQKGIKNAKILVATTFIPNPKGNVTPGLVEAIARIGTSHVIVADPSSGGFVLGPNLDQTHFIERAYDTGEWDKVPTISTAKLGPINVPGGSTVAKLSRQDIIDALEKSKAIPQMDTRPSREELEGLKAEMKTAAMIQIRQDDMADALGRKD